jgi:hypothetical protein
VFDGGFLEVGEELAHRHLARARDRRETDGRIERDERGRRVEPVVAVRDVAARAGGVADPRVRDLVVGLGGQGGRRTLGSVSIRRSDTIAPTVSPSVVAVSPRRPGTRAMST